MSLNPEYKSVEDFYLPETKKPLSKPDLPAQVFRDDPASLMMPTTSKTIPYTEPQETPGFFDTLGHAYSAYNEFAQAGRFVKRELEFTHPAYDDVPDDFNPMSAKHLEQYPSNYWNWIAQAASPNDLKARQQYVTEKMHEEQYYAGGSYVANLLGGFGGGATSPSVLVPIGGMKYATIGQSVIKNMVQAAPGVAVQTIAHEGFMQATEAGGNVQDFAINSLRDTAYGVAFMGAGAGLGAGFRGAKLWNTRKLANYTFEGIDFVHEIDPKTGTITGRVKATSSDQFSISAKLLDEAQQFADVSMEGGWALNIPGVQKLAGNSILGSPIVKGLSHPFATVRAFTDKMASHSIITERVARGEARPDSAEDILSQFGAGAADFHLQFKGHFYEENGITGGVNARNATRALLQRAKKEQPTSIEEFSRNVIDAAINEDFSYSKSTNAAAKLWTEYTDNIYKEFMRSKGLPEEILPPRNARGYFTTNLDPLILTKDAPRFREVIANEFKRQDEKLSQIMQPLEDAKKFLAQLEEHKLAGAAHDRSMVNEIKAARQKVRDIQMEIERKARSGKSEDEDYPMLLTDRNFITLKESAQLKELLTPLAESKAVIAEQANKIKKLKKDLSKVKSGAKKAVTKEATNANIKKMKLLEKEIEKEQAFHDDLINNHEEIKSALDQRAHDGEIPTNFYTKDENVIHWRDPEEWAKFRDPFVTHEARIDAAEAYRNLWLNHTTEQVQQAMLSTMMPGQFANPIKRRTFMVPASLLNKERFMRSDIPQAAAAYSRTLGRHIALNRVFGDVNVGHDESGSMGMARILAKERATKEAAIDNPSRLAEINKIENEAERNKALADLEKSQSKERLQLEKDFQDATKHMKSMMDIFMGNTNASSATLRVNRALKNFAAATKLGGVPIAQLTDLGAIILKQGMWPFLRDGLKPMLEGLWDKNISEARKRNAADAHLAYQHVSHGYSQKFYDSGSVGEVPIATHLENALDNIAHLSGNFFGTNAIENLNQRLTASIMQSKIMRHMYEYMEGTLSERDKTALLQYGLDPKEWAEKFIKNFEGSTGWKDNAGAYQSKYWEWKDDAAVAQMARTLRRGVYDTVVQRGLFTSPFWTNNPILSTMFMFHGWAFAAFNRYTVPMMQRMDSQKLIGIVTMMALGAMTDPLRRLASGKKPDLDDDTWFGKTFTVVSNSGVLGHTTDMIQMANKFVDGKLLPQMTERYKGYNKWSLLGPAAGIADDFSAILKATATGKMTENTAKRAIRLVPGTSSIPLRGLTNKWIESLNLPQSEEEAQGYSWRQ